MLRSRLATRSSWPGKSIFARRDAGLQGGVEDHEIPPKPVCEAVDLSDLILAVIAQQPDLSLIEVGAGELLDAVLQDCPATALASIWSDLPA